MWDEGATSRAKAAINDHDLIHRSLSMSGATIAGKAVRRDGATMHPSHSGAT